ncbi:MAG: sodium:proton antiporter [Bacteroidia bacterium]|nr:sodium:proton antiporter [Bacteroidia bacterium]
MFEVFSLVVAIAALFSFINHKLLKLPSAIGVLTLSLAISLVLVGFQVFFPDNFLTFCEVVTNLDFRTILFKFLLGFLLFAGAIHVNLTQLLEERGPVIVFATLGVVVSTFIIGGLVFLLSEALSLGLKLPEALVFGALISPTDPVAVLNLLRKANVDKKLEIKIVGESLFNDGIGIVVFLTLLAIAGGMSHGGGEEITVSSIAISLLKEAGGGLLLGALLGYLGILSLNAINDEPIIEVHITIAIVMGGYALAETLGISGALAMVVAGLMIGNSLSRPDIPQAVKTNMNTFWLILDEVLNAVLFVMIGIEVLILEGMDSRYFIFGGVAILLVLVSRYISVLIGNSLLPKAHRSNSKELVILTWAGLRGGISIALALNLSDSMSREPILFATYLIVIFSILVQGLSIGALVKRLKN